MPENSNQQARLSKRKRPLVLLWVVLSLLTLFGLGALYQSALQSAEHREAQALKSLTDSKVLLLDSWLAESTAGLQAFVEDKSIIRLYPELQNSSKYRYQVGKRVLAFLNSYEVGRLELFDQNGQALLHRGQASTESAQQSSALIQQAKRSQRPQIQLFVQQGQFYLDIVVPVLKREGKRALYLGAAVLHIEPVRTLVPLSSAMPASIKTKADLLFSGQQAGQSNHFFKLTPLDGGYYQLHRFDSKHPIKAELVESNSQSGDALLKYRAQLNGKDWLLMTSMRHQDRYAELYAQFSALTVAAILVLLIIALFLSRSIRSAEYHAMQAQLQKGQAYFAGLFMDAPVAYQSLNAEGRIVNVNSAWCRLFGYQRQEVLGQPYANFIKAESVPVFHQSLAKLLDSGSVENVLCEIVLKDGSSRYVSVSGRMSEDEQNAAKFTHCVLVDITEQRLHEQRQQHELDKAQALFELSTLPTTLDEKALLAVAMDRLQQLTASQAAFVHFVSEDQNEIQLAAWSSTTQQQSKALNDKHYPVDGAGIWADSIRTAQAKVVNDYAQDEHKTGLLEGHTALERLVTVPIISDDLVRMIIGVGNATEPYDDLTVSAITQYGNELYHMVLVKRMQLSLTESEARFHNLFLKAPLPYLSMDIKGRLLNVNESWLALFCLSEADYESVIGQPIKNFLSRPSAELIEQMLQDIIQVGSIDKQQIKISCDNGNLKEVEISGRLTEAADKQLSVYCILTDVTAKHRAERELRLATMVYEHAGEGLLVTNKDREITSVNAAFTDILGYEEQELLGKNPSVFASGKHDSVFYKKMWQAINHDGIWQGEIWNRHKSGALVPEWMTLTRLDNDQGQVDSYVAMFADISKLKASQAELDYLAHHDVLTRLPNRRRFMHNLEYTILHAKRDHITFAVLMLDLDRFKAVNDSYGHASGDELLINSAKMLKETIREVDTVARLGGDEFAILLEGLHDSKDAGQVATTIIQTLSEPQRLSNKKLVSVGGSIGIALYPDHGIEAEALMQHADSALYMAKRRGRGTFEYFSAQISKHASKHLSIEAELKQALKNREFRVFFQPQIDLKTGRVKGAEALVRWQHPDKGLLPPGYFIDIAEESGLIADIGAWVLQETCRQAQQWRQMGQTDFVYAVNISAKQLNYIDMFSVIEQALKNSGLPAEQLELEITESGLMSFLGSDAVNLFERLQNLGVSVAIDDFGTGYSSLAYLKNLPIDTLKIDKSFVDDIPHNEQGMQIVNAIIAMGQSLHLKVLAEGVESESQREFLAAQGCHYYQGYLTSKPIEAQLFESLYIEPSLKPVQ